GRLTLRAGDAARPAGAVAWARRAAAGGDAFLVTPDLPLGEGFLPVSPAAWIAARADTELETRSTAETLAGDPTLDTLQAFARAFLACVGVQRRRGADEEAERVRRRARSFRAGFLG